jgi:hypothetical protein
MPTRFTLALLMRRLLAGYAVTFNRTPNRTGHLFQNRYKSIVCEKEAYLSELIRYIHLNPIRAGLVNNLEELERYPWSGHAVVRASPHAGKSDAGVRCDGDRFRHGARSNDHTRTVVPFRE